jgi:hypothetical protein
MSTTPSPFQDHAAPILAGEPSITDDQRANLHDIFHGSKDPNELASKLSSFPVPDDLKHKLWTAKQASTSSAPPVDKVTEAVQRLAAMDPQTLDVAESHPNLLKAFTAAATTEPKAPQEPAAASSPAGKGKTASAAPKIPTEPRLDGQPHFPPIPDGHHRILASDGGVHDIPAEKIDEARKIDPLLHVLNP